MCFGIDDPFYPSRVVVHAPPVVVAPPPYHSYASRPWWSGWWNNWSAPVYTPPVRRRVAYTSRPTPVVVGGASPRMPMPTYHPHAARPTHVPPPLHRDRVVAGGPARVVPGYRR